MGFIAPKSSKITKIHGIPLLHEGYFRKNHKKGSNGGQLVKNVEVGCENFATCEILKVAKFFTTLQNFAVAHFLLFSTPLFSNF